MVSAHSLRACAEGDTFRIPLAFVTLLQRFDAVISVSRVSRVLASPLVAARSTSREQWQLSWGYRTSAQSRRRFCLTHWNIHECRGHKISKDERLFVWYTFLWLLEQQSRGLSCQCASGETRKNSCQHYWYCPSQHAGCSLPECFVEGPFRGWTIELCDWADLPQRWQKEWKVWSPFLHM